LSAAKPNTTLLTSAATTPFEWDARNQLTKGRPAPDPLQKETFPVSCN